MYVYIFYLIFMEGKDMLDNEQKTVAKKNYKSPIGKLTKFFEKSRDKWKSKYLDAKYAIKLLRNQVQYSDISSPLREPLLTRYLIHK